MILIQTNDYTIGNIQQMVGVSADVEKPINVCKTSQAGPVFPISPRVIPLYLLLIAIVIMIKISRLLAQGYRRLKDVKPQSWVEGPPSTPKILKPEEVPQLEIKDYREIKRTYKRGLQGEPIPVSATLHAIRIQKPKVSTKMYRWCSCGMSAKQPLCDESHDGTLFKPLKFRIQEKVDFVQFCGCKLSTNKPFCDGHTCAQLRAKEAQRESKEAKTNE